MCSHSLCRCKFGEKPVPILLFPHLHISISPSLYITLYPHNSTYPWFKITPILFQTAPSLTIGSVISSLAPGASSLSQDLSAAGEPSPHSCGHGQDRGLLAHGHPRLKTILILDSICTTYYGRTWPLRATSMLFEWSWHHVCIYQLPDIGTPWISVTPCWSNEVGEIILSAIAPGTKLTPHCDLGDFRWVSSETMHF